MMRKIKFRAWDIKYEKMYYQNVEFAYVGLDDTGKPFIDLIKHSILKCPAYPYRNIIIMQYTGLKDKNGVEIYEGDIVKKESGFGLGHREGKPKYGKVTFYKDVASYCIAYKDQREVNVRYAHLVHTESDLEVVGNIFENPELLKEVER